MGQLQTLSSCSRMGTQTQLTMIENFARTAPKFLYVCLLFLPFTVNAVPDGEIIFTQVEGGIWRSNGNGRNVQRLFHPPLFILEMSIQEGDRYLLVVGEGLWDKARESTHE